MNRTVTAGARAGQVAFSNELPLAFIAGPCVIESEEHVRAHGSGDSRCTGLLCIQSLV